MHLKIKVIYIISNINKALAFEWIASLIGKERFNLKFILLGQKNTQLSYFLLENKIPYFEINYQSKPNSYNDEDYRIKPKDQRRITEALDRESRAFKGFTV